MFFSIIGVGVFVYGIVHSFLACIFDCDIGLAFCEKFGKSIRKYTKHLYNLSNVNVNLNKFNYIIIN